MLTKSDLQVAFSMFDAANPAASGTLLEMVLEDTYQEVFDMDTKILPYEYGPHQTELHEPNSYDTRGHRSNGIAHYHVAQGAIVFADVDNYPIFTAGVSYCSLLVGKTYDGRYVAAHIDFSRECQLKEAMKYIDIPLYAIVSVGKPQQIENKNDHDRLRSSDVHHSLEWYYRRVETKEVYEALGFKVIAFETGRNPTIVSTATITPDMMAQFRYGDICQTIFW